MENHARTVREGRDGWVRDRISITAGGNAVHQGLQRLFPLDGRTDCGKRERFVIFSRISGEGVWPSRRNLFD
jgi:hypothetical protein